MTEDYSIGYWGKHYCTEKDLVKPVEYHKLHICKMKYVKFSYWEAEH